MDLRGWDYTGRNISSDFHKKMMLLTELLLDEEFMKDKKWNTSFQNDIAPKVGLSSGGSVRTLKTLFETFGFYNKMVLDSANDNIKSSEILTDRGKVIYNLAAIENKVLIEESFSEEIKKSISEEVNKLYEECYADAMMNYSYMYDDAKFSPLRATMKALSKYGYLDKWEWYLLNTIVRHNDDVEEEQKLDDYIRLYRNNEIMFSMENVIEKPKGHQYVPQYFEYAGLICISYENGWQIRATGKHLDIQNFVVSDDYLKMFLGGIVVI